MAVIKYLKHDACCTESFAALNLDWNDDQTGPAAVKRGAWQARGRPVYAVNRTGLPHLPKLTNLNFLESLREVL